MNSTPKIYVAGHRGMVGSAIVRQLVQGGLSPESLVVRTHQELDLTNQAAVQAFFKAERPTQVYLAAAKVGGIYANNTYPADFIYQNLMVQANVIDAAFQNGVQKLLFLGSSCIYPKLAPQPMTESALLTGPLEPTNEPYAIAKIVGIKLCESYNRQYGVSHSIDYRSVMPTNLYGPGDNYHPQNSHVIPALIRKCVEAIERREERIVCWGSGAVTREFLHAADCAEGILRASESYNSSEPVNLGSGFEISIRDLAEKIAQLTGFTGELVWDPTQPDGQPRRCLDVTRAEREFGFRARIGFDEGLRQTIDWYLANRAAR